MTPPNDSPYGTSPAPRPPSPPAAPQDPSPGQPAMDPASQQAQAPTGNGSPPPAPSSDPQAVQRAVQEALSPLQAEIAALREENASLRGSQSPTPAPSEPAPKDSEAFIQSFLNDPEAALAKPIEAGVRNIMSQFAPLLQRLNQTAHDGILEGHRELVDREFGAGTFQEELMPILAKRLELAAKENPTLLADQDWISSEVARAKGFKMDSLVDRRGKAASAKDEAEKAQTERILSQFNATNLIGGIRGGGEKPREPTADEQAYLDSCAKGGFQLDLQTLRKGESSGSDLKSLEEAFKPEGQ